MSPQDNDVGRRPPRLRAIAQVGAPILRQPTRTLSEEELGSAEVQDLIDDLIATMRHANGAGLAANQIFEPVRICAIEVGENPRYPYKPKIPLTVLVNPVLTPVGDETFVNYEGCLSVPDLRGEVERSAQVRVQALDRDGAELDFVAKGITAGTFQHECDHLDGMLFLDRVTDPSSLCTWANFRAHREADFRARVAKIVTRYGA
ncbi:MAG: peptide deformylase [Nannocystaceae bacterium]